MNLEINNPQSGNGPDSEAPSPIVPAPSLTRATAFLEVVLCSGFPTQIALIGVLQALGVGLRDPEGRLSIGFVMALSLADTALIVGLVLLFLRAHGERVRDVLVGPRDPARETAVGLALVPAAYLIVVLVLGSILVIAPWLRNVPRNPLEDLLTSDLNRLLFGIVVVVGGGLREEIQRAFILHRFEQRLGGAIVGLVIFSGVFGVGHLDQGRDVAIATGLLGAFWGGVYLWRRNVVVTAVSHAGFNVLEIVRHALLPGRAGIG